MRRLRAKTQLDSPANFTWPYADNGRGETVSSFWDWESWRASDEELDLARLLARFEDALLDAQRSLQPHKVGRHYVCASVIVVVCMYINVLVGKQMYIKRQLNCDASMHPCAYLYFHPYFLT
jgi:hypothetical protein